MTLKTKVRIFVGITFLLVEVSQYLIARHLLHPYPGDYIILLFLMSTAVVASVLVILFLENNLLSKYFALDRIITKIAESHKSLAHPPLTGKDEVSRLTDFIFRIREELQQSEDALQNSQDILQAAQKFASVGSWNIDPKTGRVRCSTEMYHITGLDSAHISSNYTFMANIIHPEDRQSVKKALQESLRGNRLCSIDYRAILPGGSQRTLHAEGEVKYDNDRQLFKITGVLYDVTKQRILEELQFADGKGFSLLDINPDPVLIIDGNMTVQYINEAFEKMAGYSAKDVLGTTPPYPWWPEELHEKYAKLLSRDVDAKMKRGEYLFKKKGGRNIWVESTPRTVKRNGDVWYRFFYLVDITRQKRLKENMQFYISAITKTQEEERKRIALEIHDEIIQNLASFALEIDALSKDKNKLPDDLPTRLHELRDGIEGVINGLRSFSHELHPSVIDQGLIPALETLTQEISNGTDINVQLTTYGKERQLQVDLEICLFRIAQEATRNVVKHSGATEAAIKLRYTSNSIKLTIVDNGIGFELPEELGDLASKHKLGIISMQERSRLFDGKFSLRSRVGRGTTVRVEVQENK